ncbi:MAG: hypothetical protein WCK01_01000 [Candidatus Uhrbacteria bacterium]
MPAKEPEEVDPDDVEELLEEEITDPAIQRELLLAEIGEQLDNRINPLDDIGRAARDNPDALDALLDSWRMESLPPPAPAPPVDEEDPEEAAFYAKISRVPAPPKPK